MYCSKVVKFTRVIFSRPQDGPSNLPTVALSHNNSLLIHLHIACYYPNMNDGSCFCCQMLQFSVSSHIPKLDLMAGPCKYIFKIDIELV